MKHTFLFGSAALAALAAGAQQRPNIIYIMCDDMGYGDLGCYGQRLIATPNIDRLANQGMRFTQAYAGSPVSAPSRACFMTGQHTGHTHVRANKEYWTGSVQYGANTDYARVGQEPYDANHVIIPEIFKDNGYTTGMFGKWAGGYEGSHSTPDKRGIDEFYGYICQFQAHLYYPNFLNSYSRSAGDDGVIIGNNGLPFSSSLTTYLMSVAKNNNKEIVRSSTKLKMIDDIAPRKQKDDNGTTDLSSRLPSEPIDDSMSDYKADQYAMADIVADIVANLSERCSQILTLFYYKEKKLDDIMEELSSFNSKDALKTAKNKCLNKLKAVATQRYNDYLNA